jgi:hypothetical protein
MTSPRPAYPSHGGIRSCRLSVDNGVISCVRCALQDPCTNGVPMRSSDRAESPFTETHVVTE